MSTDDYFYILPAGRHFITTPWQKFSVSAGGETYVYGIQVDPDEPVSCLAVGLSPEWTLSEGMGATVSARLTRGVESGEDFFIGSLTPDKPSCFASINAGVEGYDGITVHIVKRPLSRVRLQEKAYRSRKARSPFHSLG